MKRRGREVARVEQTVRHKPLTVHPVGPAQPRRAPWRKPMTRRELAGVTTNRGRTRVPIGKSLENTMPALVRQVTAHNRAHGPLTHDRARPKVDERSAIRRRLDGYMSQNGTYRLTAAQGRRIRKWARRQGIDQ